MFMFQIHRLQPYHSQKADTPHVFIYSTVTRAEQCPSLCSEQDLAKLVLDTKVRRRTEITACDYIRLALFFTLNQEGNE